MWMIIIFHMDRDENCGRLSLYLMLIVFIFVLQVFTKMLMCFNYFMFDLLFNYSFLRFRESGQ